MGLASLQILIGDDHELARSIVADILRGAGLSRIRKVASGEEARSAIWRTAPDIVIADMSVLMDDAGLLEAIRTHRDSPDQAMAVIAMTAYSDLRRIERLRDAGATEILAKPLSARSLMRRIVSVVDHPRAFVRAPRYAGPDRRRRLSAFAGPERRVARHSVLELDVA